MTGMRRTVVEIQVKPLEPAGKRRQSLFGAVRSHMYQHLVPGLQAEPQCLRADEARSAG